jgi:cytochrome b561/polyisoprenoid-binding protein YceI
MTGQESFVTAYAKQTVTTPGRYRAPAITLHWLIAILIFGGYGLGLFMHDLPASADKLQYYSWHKWAGVTVFVLALLRAGWRLTHPAPPLVSGPRWEHWAAHGAHLALYLLMLAIPLSGWLHSSASGYQTVYLGLLPIPDLIGKSKPVSEFFADLHEWLNYALLLVLLLHAAAALQHHWLRRDDVLRRMLPTSGAGGLAILVTVFAAIAFGGIFALKLSDDDEAAGHSHGAEIAAPAADANAGTAAMSGEIAAEFRQMNVPVSGTFTKFSAIALQFDAEHLDQAHAEILVDTGSYDLGDADYNAEVRKKEWLDSSAFPQARFVTDHVEKLADGRYQASGQLTIKDKTLPLSVPFTMSADGERMNFSGEATLSRAAYGIGDAEWNDVLEDKVIVRFKVSVPRS